jgi:hypothetical protein
MDDNDRPELDSLFGELLNSLLSLRAFAIETLMVAAEDDPAKRKTKVGDALATLQSSAEAYDELVEKMKRWQEPALWTRK